MLVIAVLVYNSPEQVIVAFRLPVAQSIVQVEPYAAPPPIVRLD